MPASEITLELLLDTIRGEAWADTFRSTLEVSVARLRYVLVKELRCSRQETRSMIDSLVGRHIGGYLVLRNKDTLYILLPKFKCIKPGQKRKEAK